MGLLLLVPGIILLATHGWFADQHTVGLILTWIGGALIALQTILFILAAWAASSKASRF